MDFMQYIDEVIYSKTVKVLGATKLIDCPPGGSPKK